MNKLVKGDKNLAFALSFVTVAACGGVKKADLDFLKDDLTVEVQKVKTEVLDWIASGRKEALFDILRTDFSGLGEVVKRKGAEKLLEGFVFSGKIVNDSNCPKIVGGVVEKDGFEKNFNGNKILCDDKFFGDFVKCGGVVEIEDLGEVVFNKAGSSQGSKIRIGDIDQVAVGDLIKFLGFLKTCNLLGKASGLKFEECFKTAKKFSCIDDELSGADSRNIVGAVADEESVSYQGGDTDVELAKFKIGGVDYEWRIAKP